MEGKAIGMLAAFALIACFAGGLSYYLEIDSKRHDLSEAQTQLTNARSGVETKRATVDSVRTKLQALREQIDSHTSLTDAKVSLTAQIANLESQKTDLHAEFVKAVQKVRSSSVGIQWPDVTLGNGQVLTGVTIQKVTETDVSVTHAGGVAKIAVADLPIELKERFRYNMMPMVQPSEKPKGTAGGAPGAPGGAPAAPYAFPATDAQAPPDKKNEMQGLADKITALQNQIRSLEDTRAAYVKQASQHRVLGIYAQERGRPSSTHYTNANAAEQQAAVVGQQINAVHNQISQLQSKIR